MKLQTETLVLVGAVAVVTVGTAWMLKSAAAAGAGSAAGVGEAVGGAVVEAVTGAATGAVVAIGQAVGIPATNQDQCSIDLAAGDLWAASFSCPAGRFLKEGVFK